MLLNSVLAAVFFVGPVGLMGCTYVGDISGYVEDKDRPAANSNRNFGINGATLRVYFKEPESASDPDFELETATYNSGSADGYYFQQLAWKSVIGDFNKDRDKKDIYIGLTHPNYLPIVVPVYEVLSKTTNILPNIRLTSVKFEVEEIKGMVETANGPENGVRVVLRLDGTEAPNVDYVTETMTVDGSSGMYQFMEVEFFDMTAEGLTTATISVEDDRYTNPIPTEVETMLLHLDQPSQLETIQVDPVRPDEFRATIHGETYWYYITATDGEYQRPIEGIEVQLDWNYDDHTGSEPRTLRVRTDENGLFSAQITWRDESIDEEFAIPPGEDQIEVTVSYPDGGHDGSLYTLSPYNDTHTIRSWSDNNLPDAIDEDPSSDPPTEPEKVFSFVVISDPHISSGNDHLERLQAATTWINDNVEERELELVLITGDIGWAEGLQPAADELETLTIPYAPINGDNEITYGSEFDFEPTYSSVWDDLSTGMDEWAIQMGPAFNTELDMESAFHNYAFTYKGVRFLMVDWASRDQDPILQNEGYLHNFAGGSFEFFAQEIVASAEQLPNGIIIGSHVPLAIAPGAFAADEITTVGAVTQAYADLIYANFAGHFHANGDVSMDPIGMHIYVTDALWNDDVTVRVVDVYKNNVEFSYEHELVVVPYEGE